MPIRNNGFAFWRRTEPTPIENPERKNFFERNPAQIQFWVSILLVLVSIYYSKQSLNETKKSYDMAKEQFDSLKVANRRNDSISNVKDMQASVQYTKDTLRIAKRDKFQKESFDQQLEVNKHQLSAFKLQAQVAKKQYDFQSQINLEQRSNDRPIFMLHSVSYDSIRNLVTFEIRNAGKRSVTMTNSSICGLNKAHLELYTNIDTISKSELNESTTTNLYLTMPKWEYDQSSTIYYVSFKYIDPVFMTPQIFTKFFRFTLIPDRSPKWKIIYPSEVKLIKDKAKTSNFKIETH
jgi:hypothetical protein